MDERLAVEVMWVAGSGAHRSKAEDPAGVRRGRAWRRSVDERTEAVVELLSGKATVDQVAFRFGVHPKTVEKWREAALEGIEQSMRQGSGKSKQERELERKLKALERAFTDLAIRYELVERALFKRPTRPGRSVR
jgi:transposase-like protein